VRQSLHRRQQYSGLLQDAEVAFSEAMQHAAYVASLTTGVSLQLSHQSHKMSHLDIVCAHAQFVVIGCLQLGANGVTCMEDLGKQSDTKCRIVDLKDVGTRGWRKVQVM
jgi:hypothetical protein